MIQIGWRYEWPDGRLLDITGASYTGHLRARIVTPMEGYFVDSVDIPASDLETLIKNGIVTSLGPTPKEGT